MTETLDYAPHPAREGSASWLWTLIAIPLLCVAMSILVPRFTSPNPYARQAAAHTDVKMLRLALDALRSDTGRYPTSAEGLGALVHAPRGLPDWHGPYLLRGLPSDPWGNPYAYTPLTGSSPPKVTSAGLDGVSGTADDIAAP